MICGVFTVFSYFVFNYLGCFFGCLIVFAGLLLVCLFVFVVCDLRVLVWVIRFGWYILVVVVLRVSVFGLVFAFGGFERLILRLFY